uniref:Uncharacterized protein n=1 Tax=Oryza glumipatula TaxID=40148 RepID=A0A0D9ZGC2_9ORYZ
MSTMPAHLAITSRRVLDLARSAIALERRKWKMLWGRKLQGYSAANASSGHDCPLAFWQFLHQSYPPRMAQGNYGELDTTFAQKNEGI